jgi:hypothetical protein
VHTVIPWDFGTFTVHPQNCEAVFGKDARQNNECPQGVIMTGTKEL